MYFSTYNFYNIIPVIKARPQILLFILNDIFLFWPCRCLSIANLPIEKLSNHIAKILILLALVLSFIGGTLYLLAHGSESFILQKPVPALSIQDLFHIKTLDIFLMFWGLFLLIITQVLKVLFIFIGFY